MSLKGLKKRAQRLLPYGLWRAAGDLYYYARLPFVLGTKVTCPCCGWRFRRFVKAICSAAPPVICPRCFSTPRDRFMWLYLSAVLLPQAGRVKILHFAPERNLQRNLKRAPGVEYLGADIDSPYADLKVDIQHIQIADNKFDGIICSHVLEHIPDDRRAMGELFRILAPGGWALLIVPLDKGRAATYEDASVVDPAERERLFGQDDHVRVYGRDFVDRLAEAGFAVEPVSCAGAFGTEGVGRHGLNPEEDLFICRKPGN